MECGKFRFSFKSAVMRQETMFLILVAVFFLAMLGGLFDSVVASEHEVFARIFSLVVLAFGFVVFGVDAVRSQRVDYYKGVAEQLMREYRIIVSWRTVRDSLKLEGSFVEAATVFERLDDGSVRKHGWYVQHSQEGFRVYSYDSGENVLREMVSRSSGRTAKKAADSPLLATVRGCK